MEQSVLGGQRERGVLQGRRCNGTSQHGYQTSGRPYHSCTCRVSRLRIVRRLRKDNKRVKQINKPGSVPPVPSTGDDDHSSGTYVTACLKRPNPEASGEQPLSRPPPGGRKWESLSIWSCSGWGLPSSRCHHRDWCALTTPFHPYQDTPYSGSPFRTCTWRSVFCGTFLRVTPTGRYPAPCSAEPGLSSPRPQGEERSS
jgi:hypothetical protein